MTGPAPLVADSTREERASYVDEHYHCISDCDLCGLCSVFHGREPMIALADYINGKAELADVLMRYR